MIFSISLKEEQLIGMNNFTSLETILSEFYEKHRQEARGIETQNPQKQVSDYFSAIINSNSNNADNVEKLSNLSSVSVIRLYHTSLNKGQKTMKIIELTPKFLSSAFSPKDLKEAYFTSDLTQIICFILPDIYQLNCLNIFETYFETTHLIWILKGILCIRGSLSITITKNSSKKMWILESKFSNFSKAFDSLAKAFSAMSDKGFVPISFFYFYDNVKVSPEPLNFETLNYAQLINPTQRLIGKFKSKCITKDKFREQVVINGVNIGILEQARQKERGNLEGKFVDSSEEIKASVTNSPIGDMKSSFQLRQEENVNSCVQLRKEENFIKDDKFDFTPQSFDESMFSVDLKSKYRNPIQNAPLSGYETFEPEKSLSVIDKVEGNN